MEIYVVQTGDTIDTIAKRYEISVEKLIIDNQLTDPSSLVPGEVVVIVYPSVTYTVQPGDTLENIAAKQNISINELLRNNPIIFNMERIYPGELLTIDYNRTNRVSTHGYTNTFIDRKTLRKTLPYLSYLSIFNYRTVKNGEVVGSNDDIDIIQLSKEFGVIPLLHMSTLSIQGDIDIEITNEVLNNDEIQNRLFDNILRIVKENGYYGVNISAQYLTSETQSLFYNYSKKLSDRLKQEGYISFITINPKVEVSNDQITYEDINYSNFVNIVDFFLFLKYKWGIDTAPPSPVISVSNLNVFLNHAISQIPQEKIYTGLPTFGYIWQLPYVAGVSSVNSLTLDSVINLAREVGATIQFDEDSQTPYFIYKDNNGSSTQYIVWFINAITVNSLVNMSLSNNISGIGIWNIMTYFPQLWLVINSQYEIIKFLPEF